MSVPSCHSPCVTHPADTAQCSCLPPSACATAALCPFLPCPARLLTWRRSDAATCKEIADMIRVGSKSGMRVGPAAATQLLELLRSDNPDLKVKGDDKAEAQSKRKKKG